MRWALKSFLDLQEIWPIFFFSQFISNQLKSGLWLFPQESPLSRFQANKANTKTVWVPQFLFHKRHEFISLGDDSNITFPFGIQQPVVSRQETTHFILLKWNKLLLCRFYGPELKFWFWFFLSGSEPNCHVKKGLLILVPAHTLSSFIYVHGPQPCLPQTAIFIFIIFIFTLTVP